MDIEKVVTAARHDIQVGLPVVVGPEGAVGIVHILYGQKHIDAAYFEVGRFADWLDRRHPVACRLGADLFCQLELPIHGAGCITAIHKRSAFV